MSALPVLPWEAIFPFLSYLEYINLSISSLEFRRLSQNIGLLNNLNLRNINLKEFNKQLMCCFSRVPWIYLNFFSYRRRGNTVKITEYSKQPRPEYRVRLEIELIMHMLYVHSESNLHFVIFCRNNSDQFSSCFRHNFNLLRFGSLSIGYNIDVLSTLTKYSFDFLEVRLVFANWNSKKWDWNLLKHCSKNAKHFKISVSTDYAHMSLLKLSDMMNELMKNPIYNSLDIYASVWRENTFDFVGLFSYLQSCTKMQDTMNYGNFEHFKMSNTFGILETSSSNSALFKKAKNKMLQDLLWIEGSVDRFVNRRNNWSYNIEDDVDCLLLEIDIEESL